MKVHLTFDVETWCNGWDALDATFRRAFDRYIYGRSPAGAWGLPGTLDILDRHGLQGVFFVEPLFSARFGAPYLAEVVRLIADRGHDVQLHIHPEWTDELPQPPIADARVKRQHLSYYTLQEQTQLLRYARALLEDALGSSVHAFRAGSYAVNDDTYEALRSIGITADSSFNEVFTISAGPLRRSSVFATAYRLGGLVSYPVTVFNDGLGRMRPAQVTASSFAELRQSLLSAQMRGCRHYVIVSHSFELLQSGRSTPDTIVVRRFDQLCAFLASRPDLFQVLPFPRHPEPLPAPGGEVRPAVSVAATLRRLAEQAARRFV